MDSFLSGSAPPTGVSTTVTLAIIGLTIVVLALLAVASVVFLSDVLSGEAEHLEREESEPGGTGRAAP